MPNVIIIILIVLVSLFIIGTIVVCSFLDRKVHLKTRVKKRDPDYYIAGGVAPERISFRTSDGIPAVGLFYSASKEKKPIVILLHGYAYHMGGYHERTSRLLKEGWHVFTFDFRGCGESPHNTCTIGLKETLDVLGAVEYLKSREDVDLDKMILWGGSMGAVTALRSMKILDNITAVIADSPYYDMLTVLGIRLKRKNIPSFISHYFALVLSLMTAGNQWKNSVANDIRNINSVPVLFIHGDKDIDIDVDDTIRLHGMYKGPKQLMILEGHTHHDHDNIPGYIDESIEFIKKHLSSSE